MSIDFYDCLTILPSFLTMGAVLVKYQKQKGEEGLPFLHLNVIEVCSQFISYSERGSAC